MLNMLNMWNIFGICLMLVPQTKTDSGIIQWQHNEQPQHHTLNLDDKDIHLVLSHDGILVYQIHDHNLMQVSRQSKIVDFHQVALAKTNAQLITKHYSQTDLKMFNQFQRFLMLPGSTFEIRPFVNVTFQHCQILASVFQAKILDNANTIGKVHQGFPELGEVWFKVLEQTTEETGHVIKMFRDEHLEDTTDIFPDTGDGSDYHCAIHRWHNGTVHTLDTIKLVYRWFDNADGVYNKYYLPKINAVFHMDHKTCDLYQVSDPTLFNGQMDQKTCVIYRPQEQNRKVYAQFQAKELKWVIFMLLWQNQNLILNLKGTGKTIILLKL